MTKLPEQLIRAISIRQPYIELILRGTKRAEFRSRPTQVRGRVYLYAAKTLADADCPGVLDLTQLPRGFVVGSVEIVDCVERGVSDYAWKLAKPRRYRTPIVPKGQPQPVFWFPRFK